MCISNGRSIQYICHIIPVFSYDVLRWGPSTDIWPHYRMSTTMVGLISWCPPPPPWKAIVSALKSNKHQIGNLLTCAKVQKLINAYLLSHAWRRAGYIPVHADTATWSRGPSEEAYTAPHGLPETRKNALQRNSVIK